MTSSRRSTRFPPRHRGCACRGPGFLVLSISGSGKATEQLDVERWVNPGHPDGDRDLVSAAPTSVAGQLVKAGDDPTGQITATKSRHHRQRSQPHIRIRHTPTRMPASNDLQPPLVRRHRDQDRPVRISQLTMQPLSVLPDRLLKTTDENREGQPRTLIRHTHSLIHPKQLTGRERAIQPRRRRHLRRRRQLTNGHLRLRSHQPTPSGRPAPAHDPTTQTPAHQQPAPYPPNQPTPPDHSQTTPE